MTGMGGMTDFSSMTWIPACLGMTEQESRISAFADMTSLAAMME
jgi:hypothetical protein